ncbi:hypothetical protein N7539_009128 [Penicillium diatomitis]|uniref:Uncharacterized protein n=1 Tax=Penicillium diatomitis TaxID=2819901 RepID=A0A9W9WL75_9EURO|nr:uncharacterized protein N7539_009128 [Penicillium diatomitis]KAJ5469510.1 hypothetical protein N7539_009128 [Penicillium diatomitis]
MSIMDSTRQWNLYHKARIALLTITPHSLNLSFDKLKSHAVTLDEIKTQSDDTVETVKGRRDGLVNQIKLLKWVSMIYMSHAFCTAI